MMKSVLSALALFTLAFCFSCEKCATCHQTIIVQDHESGSNQTTRSSFEECGEDLKAIDGTSNTTHHTVDGQPVSSTTVSVNCDSPS